MTDCYIWQAIYHDGTVVGEYDILEGRGFADVDCSRVAKLLLLGANGNGAHVCAVPVDARPVFFRRRAISLNEEQETRIWKTAHCIGWKRESDATYLFVFEDGSTLLSSEFQAV